MIGVGGWPIERFDPRVISCDIVGIWKNFTDYASAVEFNGKIYIAGGVYYQGGERCGCDTVEMFEFFKFIKNKTVTFIKIEQRKYAKYVFFQCFEAHV